MSLSLWKLAGLLMVLLLAHQVRAQDGSGSGSGDGSGDEPAAEDAAAEEEASGDGEEGKEGDGGEEPDEQNDEDEDGEEDEDAEAEEGGDDEEEGDDDEEAEAEGSGDADGSGSGSGSGSGDDEEKEEEELKAVEWQCDKDGMDEKTAGCMDSMDERVSMLEKATLSGEGGGLSEQIELVLIKKGVVDCDSDDQCADDRACVDSYTEAGRKMCERPCDRHYCGVPYAECIAEDHVARCDCKEGFHGNGTKACFPEGFTEEENGNSYKMVFGMYVEYQNASSTCSDLGARLPVLDSADTIAVIKKYTEAFNFTDLEVWDRSSRRVWVGLSMERGQGLAWADGARIMSYPASSRLFVWEARRILSAEEPYADSSRNYALYIDGDLAKLPGGGRKGAAVLCELVPGAITEKPTTQQTAYPTQGYNTQQYNTQNQYNTQSYNTQGQTGTEAPYDPYQDPRYQEQLRIYQEEQEKRRQQEMAQQQGRSDNPYGEMGYERAQQEYQNRAEDPYVDPYADQRGTYPSDGGYPSYNAQGGSQG